MASCQMLFVTGTNYDLGFQIGKTFKEKLVQHFETYRPLKKCLEYYATPEGRAFCQTYIDLCYKRFPQYMEELQGCSEATGIPLEKVLVANLEREIDVKLRGMSIDMFYNPDEKGCSDLLLNTGDVRAFGHNDDWDPNTRHMQVLICADIEPYVADDGRTFPAEKFISYTYPQYLTGFSVSFNMHGLCYSINYIYPSIVDENGSPENFILRSLVSARNLDEVIRLTTDSAAGISRGVSVNVGHLDSEKLLNIEVGLNLSGNGSAVDVLEVSPDNQFHAQYNTYNRLKVPEFKTASSSARAARVAFLKRPTNTQEIAAILGDEDGDKYRLYRNNQPHDSLITISTALFDIKKETFTLWQDHPVRSKPIVTLPLSMLRD